MDKDSLLTDYELVTVTDGVCKKYKTTWADMVDGALKPIQLEQFVIGVYTETAATQDAKTAAQVKAATLRAVGEWIVAHPALPGSTETTVVVELSTIVIEALRAGHMPEGWEGR